MYFFNPYTIQTSGPTMAFEDKIDILRQKLIDADAVVIGAGSGLSTAAGYTYTGERFDKYFSDFPTCSDDGELMTTNLRCDDSFVEDAGWHKAAQRYNDFLRRHEGLKVVYLELGVGMNTPAIIKFPFWKNTEKNKNALYACVNYGEAGCSENIVKRSVCIDADINAVVDALKG